MPRKIIIAGSVTKECSDVEYEVQAQFLLAFEGSEGYIPAPKNSSPQKSREIASFVAIFDRNKTKITAFFEFQPDKGQIICLKYGPYDNGHIVAGFENGSIAILDCVSLDILFDKDVF